MEAKDGSIGFDFTGDYQKVIENELMTCKMSNGLLVNGFLKNGNEVTVSETFDVGATNSDEQQRAGLKKKKKQLGISDVIGQALAQRETGPHVNLYVDDQILFQVVPAKHYGQRGIEGEDLSGFIELNFFNKNKT